MSRRKLSCCRYCQSSNDGAIPQGESGHKVATVQRHRGDERVQTVGAGLVGRMPVRPAYRQVALELVHIDS